MKTIIRAITFLIIITLAFRIGTYALAEDVLFLLGDSDGDGDVSITDATMIQRDVARIQLLPYERLNASDTDHDSFITVMDSSLIQRWLVHMTVFYPIGESVSKNYLDSIYPIILPSETTQVAPTSAPTQAVAELSSDRRTATAYGVDFNISGIPDTLTIEGDGHNSSQNMLLKPKADVSPEDITIQVNNGDYDFKTDYNDSRLKENYLFTEDGKLTHGYDCLVRNDKGEETAWVSAHYESGMAYPYRVSIFGLKAESYTFPIEFLYKNVLLKRCMVTVSLQENYSKIKNKLAEVRKIEQACWNDSMTNEEKLKTLSKYIADNYSYSKVMCVTGAEYVAFAARDLGLTSMLLYPVEDKDAVTYNIYFNTAVPGGHCACLVEYKHHTLRYDVQGGSYQIKEYK